ncbi:MAG: hypothetical protein IPH54_15695 [Rhodoferax sp.]|jgi:hypothetical protein|nr:hypothetical protein [Rhodoferax sp.]
MKKHEVSGVSGKAGSVPGAVMNGNIDTPDTPQENIGYQRKPAPLLACTLDTLDTCKKIVIEANAANERLTGDRLTQASDPDRHCYPHTTAANTTELALMTRRLAHFDRLGLDIDQAERQADMLQQRDREADDRRSCLECSNLTGHGRTWNCRAARQRGARGAGLPVDYTQMLTRCNAWMAQQGRL